VVGRASPGRSQRCWVFTSPATRVTRTGIPSEDSHLRVIIEGLKPPPYVGPERSRQTQFMPRPTVWWICPFRGGWMRRDALLVVVLAVLAAGHSQATGD